MGPHILSIQTHMCIFWWESIVKSSVWSLRQLVNILEQNIAMQTHRLGCCCLKSWFVATISSPLIFILCRALKLAKTYCYLIIKRPSTVRLIPVCCMTEVTFLGHFSWYALSICIYICTQNVLLLHLCLWFMVLNHQFSCNQTKNVCDRQAWLVFGGRFINGVKTARNLTKLKK